MASSGNSDGTTLLVTGGLGGNCGFRFRNWSNRWCLSAVYISDFLMLVGDPAQSIVRFLKFIKQKRWAEKHGVKFTDFISDYTFFCFWLRTGFQIVPPELSVNPGSVLCVDVGYPLNVRTKCRSTLDHHVIQTTQDVYVDVMRIDVDPYFDSLTTRPMYASIDHVRFGVLAGAIETERGASWFSIRLREKDDRFRDFAYQFWNGFIDLFYRVVVEYESQNSDLQSKPIEVCLDLTDVVMPKVDGELQSAPDIIEPEISVKNVVAIVKLPTNLLQFFQQPENFGERYVVKCIAKAILKLHTRGVEDYDDSIDDSFTNKVIGDAGVRVLHAITSHDRVEHLLQKHSQNPTLLAQEDFVFAKLELSDGCRPTVNAGRIDSRSSCNDFLNCVVVKIWNQIRDQLKDLDRTSVLQAMFLAHENIIQDRNRWRRTARAVQALYGSIDDVHSTVHEQEGMRSITDLAIRTLLEIAICECPDSEGDPLSQEQMGELLAKAALMQEVAAHSDGIRNKLIDPQIELHDNGSYSIDREFINTVIGPFIKAHVTDDFNESASKYDDLYRNRLSEGPKPVEEVYTEDFLHAFEYEFGIALQDAVVGIEEIFEIAADYDKIVVTTTVGEIKRRLSSKRGFSESQTNALISSFSIVHRPNWDIPPPGMTNRDISPWRYSRRLSVVFKPLLVFGKQDTDTVVFGVSTLQLGFRFLLSCIENGYLPQEFCASDVIKKYLGGITDLKGHEFNASVAAHLSTHGWQTKSEVPMTQLGATPELGDVDVLAWKPGGEILIVESKRLRLARTIAEISEICRRFRGEAKDELSKHLRRISWIKSNPTSLNSITGLTVDSSRIDHRLVTNVQVPMRYLAKLPIPNHKICRMDDIET
ncbi:MAG: hypothetical protein OXH02_04500 [Gemmatimonadetes bacterium]|nr:hypothetical protein [Gemmatimonadota bacterium]